LALIEAILQELPAEVGQTLRSYLKEVTELFGSSLQGVVLYGSAATGDFLPGRSNINLLLLLSQCEPSILQSYAKIQRRWGKEGVVVPLFLSEAELRASADLFPLEYGEIKEHHVLLAGRDPFPSLHIDQRNLRLQCEQEILGNLVRLRQRFVEGGGKQEAILILLPLSLNALFPCLRGLLRVLGIPAPKGAEALLKDLPSALGFDSTVLQEVLRLKQGRISPGPIETPRLFERYVSSLQSLIQRMDQLKTEGRP
jgi:predicted nucleotidyltransferase